MKGIEKVDIEDAMMGEETVRGRDRGIKEKEGLERGRKGEMVIDRGERRRGGLIHVLDRQGAETEIITAATDNLKAGTDLGRDIADTSVHS